MCLKLSLLYIIVSIYLISFLIISQYISKSVSVLSFFFRFLDSIEDGSAKPVVGKQLFSEEFKDLKAEDISIADELRRTGY